MEFKTLTVGKVKVKIEVRDNDGLFEAMLGGRRGAISSYSYEEQFQPVTEEQIETYSKLNKAINEAVRKKDEFKKSLKRMSIPTLIKAEVDKAEKELNQQ